jgi:SPP1 gp7 family putative phage head morphogenesis protein
MPADITETITEAFAQHLWGGAKEGISLVDWETPDAAFLERLQQDVWQFSSAKNRTQMRSMAQALISPDGKLRTFAEFKEAADAIAVTHKTWLQAEYDLAVAGGQMGATWSRAEANKAALPLMQYNTAGDSRVRQAHIELDGVVRPVDDPFWDYWYPPNGWGCRCDVQSLAIGQVTPMEKVIIPDDVPLMFQTNLGKAGLIFPPTHPYYSI